MKFEPIKTYEEYRQIFPWYPPSCDVCDGSGITEYSDEADVPDVECSGCNGTGHTDAKLDEVADRAAWEARVWDHYCISDGYCVLNGGLSGVKRQLREYFGSTLDRARSSNGDILIRADTCLVFFLTLPRERTNVAD